MGEPLPDRAARGRHPARARRGGPEGSNAGDSRIPLAPHGAVRPWRLRPAYVYRCTRFFVRDARSYCGCRASERHGLLDKWRTARSGTPSRAERSMRSVLSASGRRRSGDRPIPYDFLCFGDRRVRRSDDDGDRALVRQFRPRSSSSDDHRCCCFRAVHSRGRAWKSGAPRGGGAIVCGAPGGPRKESTRSSATVIMRRSDGQTSKRSELRPEGLRVRLSMGGCWYSRPSKRPATAPDCIGTLAAPGASGTRSTTTVGVVGDYSGSIQPAWRGRRGALFHRAAGDHPPPVETYLVLGWGFPLGLFAVIFVANRFLRRQTTGNRRANAARIRRHLRYPS